MTLSAEQYKEIVQSLRSHGWGRHGTEQRRAPRVGLRSQVAIRPRLPGCSSDKPEQAWLRSLSPTGMGIVHSRMLDEGSEFVAVFSGYKNRNLNILYSVAHCKPLSRTLFSIGARLKGLIAT